MKKTEFAVLISLILTIVLSSVTGFATECKNITQKVLRLHIIAENDSAYSQELKLKVRDALLENSKEIFGGCNDKLSVMAQIEHNKEKIQTLCEQTLLQNGCESEVEVTLTKMFFSNKNYETFIMPSGVYDALRITIGEGQGKNWWCVMFPPMCLSACVDKEDLSATLGENGEGFIEKSPKYTVRFKLLEYVQKLFTKAEKYEK